jgi:hypothetical protein
MRSALLSIDLLLPLPPNRRPPGGYVDIRERTRFGFIRENFILPVLSLYLQVRPSSAALFLLSQKGCQHQEGLTSASNLASHS